MRKERQRTGFCQRWKVYQIEKDSQSKVMSHLGDKVTVEAKLEGNTLDIQSVKPAEE